MPTDSDRTIVVCMSAKSEGGWFTAAQAVQAHLDTRPAPSPARGFYPVRYVRGIDYLAWRRRRRLVHPEGRRGMVTGAAGGRLCLLDLQQARHTAEAAASLRWHVWESAVRDTRPATGSQTYLGRHQADSNRLSLDQAHTDFGRQPRVLAMLANNADPDRLVDLDPYEIELYQAGYLPYTTRHGLAAMVGDAMVTVDGVWLQPASAEPADVLAYLRQATGQLSRLGRRDQLVALTATAAA